MATQKDVADLAGVSFITVSRVLNKKDNVKPETRERVEAAIKALNYYPNSFAQGLNRNATRTIAILTPIPRNIGIEDNFYYRRLLVGVEHACIRHSYDILLSAQRGLGPDFDYLRPYFERRADGLILMGAQVSTEQLARIHTEQIPCVVIGDRYEDQAINYLDTDNFGGMFVATKRLIHLGHTHIAYYHVDRYTRNTSDRYEGFRAAMLDSGLEIDNDFVYYGDFTQEAGRALAHRIKSETKKPSALLCATDLMALGFHEGAKDCGIAIPDDISLVGFDGLEIGAHLNPPLTTVNQPLFEIGLQATELLLSLIEGEERLEQIVFPVNFVERGSIKRHV